MDTMTPTTAPAFARQVADALSDMDGSAAVRFVTELHEQDIRAVAARCAGAQEETRRALADTEQATYLLAAVTKTATRETLHAAQEYARAEMAGRTLRRIGALAEQAGSDTVRVQDVMDILRSPAPPFVARPANLGFHPAGTFRVGHFATPDGTVKVAFRFVGWTLVSEANQSSVLRATFLVDGQGLTDGALYEARGLQLQSME